MNTPILDSANCTPKMSTIISSESNNNHDKTIIASELAMIISLLFIIGISTALIYNIGTSLTSDSSKEENVDYTETIILLLSDILSLSVFLSSLKNAINYQKLSSSEISLYTNFLKPLFSKLTSCFQSNSNLDIENGLVQKNEFSEYTPLTSSVESIYGAINNNICHTNMNIPLVSFNCSYCFTIQKYDISNIKFTKIIVDNTIKYSVTCTDCHSINSNAEKLSIEVKCPDKNCKSDISKKLTDLTHHYINEATLSLAIECDQCNNLQNITILQTT